VSVAGVDEVFWVEDDVEVEDEVEDDVEAAAVVELAGVAADVDGSDDEGICIDDGKLPDARVAELPIGLTMSISLNGLPGDTTDDICDSMGVAFDVFPKSFICMKLHLLMSVSITV
jgi:hypothetical protein